MADGNRLTQNVTNTCTYGHFPVGSATPDDTGWTNMLGPIRLRAPLWLCALALHLCACAAQLPTEAELADGESDRFIMAVKADGQWSACAERTVLAFVNDAATSVETLQSIRVHKRARVKSRSVERHRVQSKHWGCRAILFCSGPL